MADTCPRRPASLVTESRSASSAALSLAACAS
eukprot:CAMPEP_0119527886 /NCGR_PEP_ID=MMETSP1344-20130328/42198_1 /TAXON_ID=236787 /ORGANISM="Florenciella parvula, Strain CCMP2471" /LENGTH=31 /DNA_ID= /DNA_START= /DNA_END= /DNA_ORIENTATION=